MRKFYQDAEFLSKIAASPQNIGGLPSRRFSCMESKPK
jgi:hypothetical protein